jgi:hypothetical protein
MLTKFYCSWNLWRAIIIALFVLYTMFSCVIGNAWGLDFHLHPPGGEADQTEAKAKHNREKEAIDRNRKAERESRKPDKRDVKKEVDHEKKNGG